MNNEDVKSTAIMAVQNPTGEIAAALAKAQAAFPVITFDSEVEVRMKAGGTYRFKYATFSNLLAATRNALAENELAICQTFNNTVLTTSLLHSSGQKIESVIELPISPDMSNQDIGGVMTYFKRYAFSAIVGVSAEADDDSNGSAGNQYDQRPVGKGVAMPTAKSVANASAKPTPVYSPAPIVAKAPLNEPLTPQAAAAILDGTYNGNKAAALPAEVTESAPVNYPYNHPERGPIDSTSAANIIRGFGKVGVSQAEIEKYANYPIKEWDEKMKKLALADYKGLVAKAWSKAELLNGSLIQK